MDSRITGNYKHGYRYTKIYNIWRNIKARCYNKKSSDYSNYGARGIAICKDWLNPAVFCDWCMLNGWNETLQIDRENNNGNYEPSNCHFVTVKINNGVGKRRSLVNKSGFIGVSFYNKCNKWLATIKYNGKQLNLGYYQNIMQAAIVRKNAEIKYFGEYLTEKLNKQRISFEFAEMEKAE